MHSATTPAMPRKICLALELTTKLLNSQWRCWMSPESWRNGASDYRNTNLISYIAQASAAKLRMHSQYCLPSEPTKTKLDDEIPILNNNLKHFRNVYNVGFGQEEEGWGEYSTPRGNVVLFLPELYAFTDEIKELKLSTLGLGKFITA